MRHLLIPLLALALIGACDDDKDGATDTTVATDTAADADADTGVETTEDTLNEVVDPDTGTLATDTAIIDDSTAADTLEMGDTIEADTLEDDTRTEADTTVDDTTPEADTTEADTTPEADTTVDDTTAPTRTNLILGYCSSDPTPPGFYRGTTANQTNDFGESACGGTALGADGSVRVEVGPGETLSAVYTSDVDGILYLLDNCPVFGSCLDRSDSTGVGGSESVTWTNNGGSSNAVHLILDNDDDGEFLPDGGPFTLDLYVTAP